jgi:hypothetical protein
MPYSNAHDARDGHWHNEAAFGEWATLEVLETWATLALPARRTRQNLVSRDLVSRELITRFHGALAQSGKGASGESHQYRGQMQRDHFASARLIA